MVWYLTKYLWMVNGIYKTQIYTIHPPTNYLGTNLCERQFRCNPVYYGSFNFAITSGRTFDVHQRPPTSACHSCYSWWRHHIETLSALLAICAGNSPVPGEFPAQRPLTRSFHVFFDLRLNKPLSKQLWDWWFETLSPPLWRHCNVALKVPRDLVDHNNVIKPVKTY